MTVVLDVAKCNVRATMNQRLVFFVMLWLVILLHQVFWLELSLFHPEVVLRGRWWLKPCRVRTCEGCRKLYGSLHVVLVGYRFRWLKWNILLRCLWSVLPKEFQSKLSIYYYSSIAGIPGEAPENEMPTCFHDVAGSEFYNGAATSCYICSLQFHEIILVRVYVSESLPKRALKVFPSRIFSWRSRNPL